MYNNINRGWYKVGDQTYYFRSEWEYRYALYLYLLQKNKQIKSWTYEPRRYDFIDMKVNPPKVLGLGYLPDFEVTKNDGSTYLVEVKGKKQGMLKLKRMKKFYPDIKIELVQKDFFKELKRKLNI